MLATSCYGVNGWDEIVIIIVSFGLAKIRDGETDLALHVLQTVPDRDLLFS